MAKPTPKQQKPKLDGKFDLRVSPDTFRRINLCAHMDTRSRNNWCNLFFERYLPQEEARLGIDPQRPAPITPTIPPKPKRKRR